MTISETLGAVLGWTLAPLTGAVSLTRRARTFHPDGRVLLASVEPVEGAPRLAAIARRLAGPALVRLSSAWWRGGKEWTDALGFAMRLRRTDEPSAAAAPDDQDLLFATIRSPWTMLLAPLTTDVHDFLGNDYYAVSPFAIEGVAGLHRLRLVAPGAGGSGARDARLARALQDGRAVFGLEVRSRGGDWTSIAAVRLREAIAIDQGALRFSPFRNGRGVTPRGFVHALRHGAYAASQFARPAHERSHPHGRARVRDA
jgi:hypothetical protein